MDKKETQSRPVLCMNCSCWTVAPNVELGTCTIKQDEEVITQTTNYDSRCIVGFSQSVEKPEVEVCVATYKPPSKIIGFAEWMIIEKNLSWKKFNKKDDITKGIIRQDYENYLAGIHSQLY
jgi:hypothetical protein